MLDSPEVSRSENTRSPHVSAPPSLDVALGLDASLISQPAFPGSNVGIPGPTLFEGSRKSVSAGCQRRRMQGTTGSLPTLATKQQVLYHGATALPTPPPNWEVML